ncbi:MAG: 30S ribosomal protein S16 [Candidatus Omnitrophica bacterium]|nr:30S ribosomal protein S16 [Candidatus Omnitrophota bacterium]
MAVVLRLKRIGSKGNPYYRVIAINKTEKRDGRVIEELGHYNPQKAGDNSDVKMDKINYWLEKGAIPSATVKSIIKKFAA